MRFAHVSGCVAQKHHVRLRPCHLVVVVVVVVLVVVVLVVLVVVLVLVLVVLVGFKSPREGKSPASSSAVQKRLST